MSLQLKNYIGVPIVFFGDSITEGQHINPDFRWTDLVLESLKEQYDRTPVDIIGYNKGISGETSRQGLLRFNPDVQSLSPDILVIEFGLNDCNFWFTDKGFPRVSQSAFKANLEEMIERAKIFDIKHIILCNNHRTLRTKSLPGGKSLEESRKIYNTVISEIAHQHEVKLCDIDQWFDKIDAEDYSNYLLQKPDLLHLSELGHKHYAQKILSLLTPCIQNILEPYRIV
tara:strand:+ start:58465 stop:59148 length:684 start_codon:yes stop_codon:yes gene_type:complete